MKYCNTKLHLPPRVRTIEFGMRIRCRSPSAKMQSFLCDGYNGHNNLLGADDCCRSMMGEMACHFSGKHLGITAEDGAILV